MLYSLNKLDKLSRYMVDSGRCMNHESLLALLAAASLRTRIANGPHTAEHSRRLERLRHYAARPPLANDRLEEQPDGRLTLRLKTRSCPPPPRPEPSPSLAIPKPWRKVRPRSRTAD